MAHQDRSQDKQEQEKKQKSSLFGRKDDKSKDNSLSKKIKELEHLKEKAEREAQRALADYHNLLKRQAREKEELVKYANETLIQELIPVYDHLKLSLSYAGDKEKDSQWLKGVQYVVKQFQEVLTSYGVEEIETKGATFDPSSMEAVAGQGDLVEQEVKSGYALRGKVIIPAKVVVKTSEEETDN